MCDYYLRRKDRKNITIKGLKATTSSFNTPNSLLTNHEAFGGLKCKKKMSRSFPLCSTSSAVMWSTFQRNEACVAMISCCVSESRFRPCSDGRCASSSSNISVCPHVRWRS
ncbi:unnamed protein product [Phytomonas sp. EM1]|nr:unnamed protein product [Phytomonas sp. EM1]|eukprot:CCW65222.1 unnamed protein product [Phytomonas sp. isolate EM1]